MRGTRTTGGSNGRVLIVEADRALAGLYADMIATHCPCVRIDVCGPGDREMMDDNVGGADVVVCGCGANPATRFDSLRELMTLRSCLAVLVLIPADLPGLADEAIDCGAADVLLRAPGYLEQLPIAVRKNVAKSRAALAADARAEAVRREMIQIRREVGAMRMELDEATRQSAIVVDRARGRLPSPVITRKGVLAQAA